MKKLLQLKTWLFQKQLKQKRFVTAFRNGNIGWILATWGPQEGPLVYNLIMKFPSHKCLESNIDETSQTFTNIAIILHSDSPFAISFWSIWRIQLFQAVLAASTALLEKTGGLSTPASGYQAIRVDFFWRLMTRILKIDLIWVGNQKRGSILFLRWLSHDIVTMHTSAEPWCNFCCQLLVSHSFGHGKDAAQVATLGKPFSHLGWPLVPNDVVIHFHTFHTPCSRFWTTAFGPEWA